MPQSHNFLNLLDKKLTRDRIHEFIEIIKSKEKVIFYFHGGLSGKKYVETKLKDYLLKTMFHPDNIGAETHVIFIFYDANLFQLRNFYRTTLNIINSETFKKLIGYLAEKIPNLIDKSKEKAKNKNLSSANENKFIVKDVENYFRDNLKQEFKTHILTSETKETLNINNQKKLKKIKVKVLATIIGFFGIYGAIAKIVIRFLIKTNHELFPTITEELISKLKLVKILKKFAQKHWNTVDKNSNKIWTNKNGDYFMNELNKIFEEDTVSKPKIDFVSHSAGSIAISYFIKNIQQKNIKINNILMIVPAIKFKLFQTNIFINQHTYKKLTIYNLDQVSEEKDNLISLFNFGLIYPASLLYFVSGIAEKGNGFNDMTILGMHRYFKDHKIYNTFNKDDNIYFGNVVSIRNSFKDIEDGKNNLVFVSKNTTVEGSFGLPIIKTDGATHGGTKHPHESKELAKELIFQLTEEEKRPEDVVSTNWREFFKP